MSEQAAPVYEVTVSEFVGDGIALADQTYLATMTMVDHAGALCVFGIGGKPVIVVAPGYWTHVRYRLLEKGEMQ